MSLIDSLVIQLKLDAKGFSPEAKKTVNELKRIEAQADHTGKGIEKTGKDGAASLSAVTRAALGMFAVFTAGKGLKGFVAETTQANSNLEYMSRRLNMDPSSLNRLETAAKAAGGSFGEVTKSFLTLQQKLTDPEQAANVALTFSKLQVPDFRDEAGNVRSDIVEQLNKSFNENKIDPRLETNLLSSLGFGDGVINQVEMSTKEFGELQKQLKGMPAPTKEMTEQARHLSQEWAIFSQQSQNLTNIFASKLAPAEDAVLQKLIALEKEHPNVTGALAGITLAVGEMSKAFGNLGGIITGLAGIKLLKLLFGGGKGLLSLAGGATGLLKGAGSLAARAGGAVASGGAAAAEGVASIGARRLLALAGPVGLGLAATAEVMRPGETNKGEGELLKQMRAEGRIGPHATGSPSADPFFKTYADTVAAKESGGRYDLIGGAHDAYTGKYQMGKGAIQDAANWLREPVPTREHFLHDPEQQERFFRAYTDANNATLRNVSTAYGKMNSLQRFATLGYAHNQGAGGAADWLKTGNARRDGFGTNAEDYATDILKAGGVSADQVAKAANDPLTRYPATEIRYDQPQSDQEKAIRQIVAGTKKNQPDQSSGAHDNKASPDNGSPPKLADSILRNDHAQAVSSVTAGNGPTNTDNSTTNSTSNNHVHLHGDIVVQNTGGGGDDIGRKIQEGVRNQLNARSLLGVQ